jgi:hypothetical protein
MPPPSLTAAGTTTTTTRRRNDRAAKVHQVLGEGAGTEEMGAVADGWTRPEWCSAAGVAGVLRRHPAPALFGCGLLLFMAVEYTIPMVKPDAPPLDLGFLATAGMHAAIAARPWLNSLLAALNTVSDPHAACLDFLSVSAICLASMHRLLFNFAAVVGHQLLFEQVPVHFSALVSTDE